MTDLELPAFEVGRYIDLLKRRRWQILPVAMVGLAVGVLIAWLIPRFYEANTLVRLHPPLQQSGPTGRPGKDPFLREVSNAEYAIRSFALIEKVILSLPDWEDFFASRADPETFNAMVRSVMGRVWVDDLNRSEGRGSALLRIGYRDQDRRRSADFANSLTRHYLDSERENVRRRARKLTSQLKKLREEKKSNLAKIREDRGRWQRETGFQPNVRDFRGVSTREIEFKKLEEIERRLSVLQPKVAALEIQIRSIEDSLEMGIPPEKVSVQVDENDPVVQRQLLVPRQTLKILEQKLALLSPIHPDYESTRSHILALKTQIEEVLELLRKQGKLEAPNPAYARIKERLSQLQLEKKGAKTEQAGLQVQQKKLIAFLQHELPLLEARWDDYVTDEKTAEELYLKAEREYQAQRDNLENLEEDSVRVIEIIQRAAPPPTPTYPNRLLVSILGSVIGLGVAVGLILLLDLLQPTWKTVDEVRRGLSIPVLGGISYLVLPEEKLALQRKRLRYTLITSGVLIAMASVILVYFLDPVRLPGWVVNALDNLLGT